MKLTIDMDESWQDEYGDEQSIAKLIHCAIRDEVTRWAKAEAKALLKEKEKEAHAVIKKAFKHAFNHGADWRKGQTLLNPEAVIAELQQLVEEEK